MDAEKIRSFLQEYLKKSPNPGALTMRILKQSYLQHVGRDKLNANESSQFLPVTDSVYAELVSESNVKSPHCDSRKRQHESEAEGSDDDQSDLDSKPRVKRKVTKTSKRKQPVCLPSSEDEEEENNKQVKYCESSASEEELNKPEKSTSDIEKCKSENTSEVSSASDDDDNSTHNGARKHLKMNQKKVQGNVAPAVSVTSKTKNKESSCQDKDPKVERMKRYIKTAGLRVSYTRLFADCKSVKARVQKLLALLEDAGLKGKPSLDKCKRLRKKIEKRKELAELDRGNILNANERSRRSARHTLGSPGKELPGPRKCATPKKSFANLKGIVNSDDSSD